MTTNYIDICRVRSTIEYDCLTGKMRWKKRVANRVKVGDEIRNTSGSNGYSSVIIKGKSYQAHRVAWAIHYGEQPPAILDHINGDRQDNSIANLRPATKHQNAANKKRESRNTSGFKGVSLSKQGNWSRWKSAIKVEGDTIFLGYYKTRERAQAVYEAAAICAFGSFARAA